MHKISALITTYNEELHIRRCLQSLHWVDEIVVIDSGSQDRTQAICQEKERPWSDKMKFLLEPFRGFKERRNRLLQEASHQWVLVIDADESCSEGLEKKIRELLSHPEGPPKKAYRVRRREYFLGSPIRGGMLSRHFHERFFHRQEVYYVDDLSAHPIFPSTPGHIYEWLDHSPDYSPHAFVTKMNRITTLDAQERVKAGMRTSGLLIALSWPYYFFKNYLLYEAYKDGIRGWMLSMLEGFAHCVRHMKVWQYSQAEISAEEKRHILAAENQKAVAHQPPSET